MKPDKVWKKANSLFGDVFNCGARGRSWLFELPLYLTDNFRNYFASAAKDFA